jgi:hypothetical protein
LVPPYRTLRTAEGRRNLDLGGAPVIDKADHGVCLRHPVALSIVSHDDVSLGDHTIAIAFAQSASTIDERGAFIALARLDEWEVALGSRHGQSCHGTEKNRTVLGPHR